MDDSIIEGAKKVTEAAKKTIDDVKQAGAAASSKLADVAISTCWREAQDWTREKPALSLSFAALLGFLAGFTLARRDR